MHQADETHAETFIHVPNGNVKMAARQVIYGRTAKKDHIRVWCDLREASYRYCDPRRTPLRSLKHH